MARRPVGSLAQWQTPGKWGCVGTRDRTTKPSRAGDAQAGLRRIPQFPPQEVSVKKIIQKKLDLDRGCVVMMNCTIKKTPTSCLWQSPAITQKTKRKTRQAIRRSARWRVSNQFGETTKFPPAHHPPRARWQGTFGSWSWLAGGHCLWVLVWAGACYWHGVGGFMFSSSSSPSSFPARR